MIMKKNCILIFMISIILYACGGKKTESQIESVLKEVVIERGGGMVSEYKHLSMDIDTVKVSDIIAFVHKNFPKEKYPNGIPEDFNDEDFEKFTSPIKTKKNDEIAYLSVKHKYSIFSPMIDKKIEVIKYRLLDPISYKYIVDDLRKDDTWMAIQQYEANKVSEEVDKVFEEPNKSLQD